MLVCTSRCLHVCSGDREKGERLQDGEKEARRMTGMNLALRETAHSLKNSPPFEQRQEKS